MAFLLALVACGLEAVLGGGVADDIVSLRVDPAELTLTTELGAPASVTYVAYGTDEDGKESPLDLVTWELSNASIGAIDSRGQFTSVDSNGGNATVTAAHLDLTATASLSLIYTSTILDEGVDPGVVEGFAEAESVVDDHVWLEYPFDGAIVPRNLSGLIVDWSGMYAGEVARVRFQSALADVSVYTMHSYWEAPAEVWETITATNSRGQVDVTVTLGQWDGTTLGGPRMSREVSLEVNRMDNPGSVLYWSVYDGRIMRVKSGETESSVFYPDDDDVACFGCHSISESRQWLVTTNAGYNGRYRVLDLAEPDDPKVVYDMVESQRVTWTTVSPDGNWMVGTLQGELQLYDLPDNELVATPRLDGNLYDHPFWSPAGDALAAVRLTSADRYTDDTHFFGGEIVIIPWDGDSLGEPQSLIPRESGLTQYYPAWSPDGNYIVFNRSTDNTEADPDATLWMVSALGGEPVRLDNANGVGDLQNGLSRWAPLPDDDILWLAYSSKRPYPIDRNDVTQIWITAIEPERFERGQDPSYPPFWMPGQRTDSSNHIPVWWSQ